jgi:hypothetical protein
MALSSSQLVIEVPTRLKVTRTAEALSVSVDQTQKKPQRVPDARGVLGVESELTVRLRGDARRPEPRVGLTSGASFDLGTSLYHRAADGLPVPGAEYVVTLTLVLFETDVAVGHHWAPRSGSFRVLSTTTLETLSR